MIRMINILALLIAFSVQGCTAALAVNNQSGDLMDKFTIKQAVEERKILKGMTKEQVLASWGEPDDISTWGTDPGEEIWFYKGILMQFVKKNKRVTFQNGIVKDYYIGRWTDK